MAAVVNNDIGSIASGCVLLQIMAQIISNNEKNNILLPF